jgi:hypothetical protein
MPDAGCRMPDAGCRMPRSTVPGRAAGSRRRGVLNDALHDCLRPARVIG